MANLVSDRTASWLRQQIHSRSILAKPRPGVVLGTGGASAPSGTAYLCTITAIIDKGIYEVSVAGGSASVAVAVNNSMLPVAEYVVGDKILCYPIEMSTTAVSQI